IMEYAIGNIAVAISWADYFTSLLAGYGINVPKYFTTDYLSASRAYDQVQPFVTQGMAVDMIKVHVAPGAYEGYLAWTQAPHIGSLPIICNLPALAITVFITWLVYVGIQESKRASNAMVALKLAVILLVIGIGAFYIKPENWHPFAPNGIGGVLKG